MAEGRSVARRVLELKELLGCAQEPEEIIKTLKVLQDLDISLDILVETGIGKTVNSFRKHATAGNVAKTLVKQWKKLIPPENKSGPRGRKQNTEKEKDETKASVSEEVKHPEKSKASVLASRSSNSAPILKKLNKQRTCSEKTHRSRDRESQKECDNKEWSSSSKHASHSNNPQAKESDFKERTTTDSKKVSEKQCSSVANKDLPSLKEKPSKDASKQRNPKHVKKPNQKLVIKSKVELSSEEKQCSSVANKDLPSLKEKPSKDASKQRNPKHVEKPNQKLVIKSKVELSSEEKQCSSVANKDLPSLKEKPSKDASKQRNPKHVEKPNQKLIIKSKVELSSEEEFEPPTMSFESYLNYDQVTKKRKRKACSTGERTKCSEQNNSLPQKASKFFHEKEREDDEKKSENDQSETPNKKAKVACLQDLLNTPLPKFLTGISVSSTSYAAEFKDFLAPAVEAPQQVVETIQFTGRRLNSKMQVYSGSKTVCLSKMLTLYEQCIRVLQNNIDSLHEVGGVPFEILEPVLTRCTPEQLFRIEECNPTFTEESDHLWKKHCQRDFKNESLLEYESWREMYLRLFNQREEKLKTLTKNIISAQSEKPKGRQVKMAYVTSAAKPPRNIRRQQEIHGTAGPVTQLHPIEKCKLRIAESRHRNNSSSNPIPASNSGSSSSSVMPQDGKKPIKKIAPIMRKTLKALKSRAGRR
ncbi:elongin-A-like isoform X2 [Chroicocephalus ridibundus]|uniref:elongin-A-like isoform X2 n=1 Tax=Chroicocephalus ridibundus TaxID=1192867 RepID=UPI002FDDF53B